MKNNPLVSIVTVSLNSAKTIERTITSVLNQTYKNIEYIIIDGGSADGTIDIIKKYNDRIAYWISEKDHGIYDAMNKGIDIARGQYINFMNSDDYLYNENVIEDIVLLCCDDYDLVYGNTEIRLKHNKFVIKAPLPKYLWKGLIIHQSSFISNRMAKKYKYNINNELVADFELFLNIYYNNGKILRVNKIISSYSTGGISSIRSEKVIEDYYKTLIKYRNDKWAMMNYLMMKLMNHPWTIIKKIL